MNTRHSHNRTVNKTFPDEIELKLELAVAHHSRDELQEAASIYLEVLDTVPDHPMANFNLATIHHGSGQLRKAIGCYKKVLLHDPVNFQVLYNLASAYRDNGFPEQAAITFQRAYEIEPKTPEVTYNLGILYYQLSYPEESVRNLEETLSLDPEHFGALYNLGTICFDCEAYNKALDYYIRAHGVDPEDMDCCHNLGLTFFHLGRSGPAVELFNKIIAATPEDPFLHNTLGTIYRYRDQYHEAIHHYRTALALKPDFGSAHTNLAVALQITGDTQGAVEHFQKAIDLGHDVESAEYMIAALTGCSMENAPRSYVTSLFDGYAANFEESLVHKLDYDVPAKLYALHELLSSSRERYRHILDLGCGTGLAGEQFRDFAESMTGVDLSPKMIGQAEKKNLYDRLFSEDIVEFLQSSTESFDLVLAADVMVYLGDLQLLFEAVAEKMTQDAYFLFSVEDYDGEGYQLFPSGRYGYSKRYIEETALAAGFTMEHSWVTNIRKELDQWIGGCLFALRKA